MPFDRRTLRNCWQLRGLSAFLALLLVGLGLLVRSETAHDAFHRHDEVHSHDDHHHHHHHHEHAHGHHSHDSSSRDPVRHEHTSPLIDLLAEGSLLAASVLPPNPAVPIVWEIRLVDRPRFISPAPFFAQPPGRAPPSGLFS